MARRAARVVTHECAGRLRHAEDLSCRELVELVTDSFEDALPPEQRARFEAHVAECDACATYLEQMRTTLALTLATASLHERPEVGGLLEAFRARKR